MPKSTAFTSTTVVTATVVKKLWCGDSQPLLIVKAHFPRARISDRSLSSSSVCGGPAPRIISRHHLGQAKPSEITENMDPRERPSMMRVSHSRGLEQGQRNPWIAPSRALLSGTHRSGMEQSAAAIHGAITLRIPTHEPKPRTAVAPSVPFRFTMRHCFAKSGPIGYGNTPTIFPTDFYSAPDMNASLRARPKGGIVQWIISRNAFR